MVLSLSNSLINFPDLAPNQTHKQEVTLSASTVDNKGFKVSLIQEYPLKNFSGDTIELKYSIFGENIFRSLPNENKGESPTVILNEKDQGSKKINFNIKSPVQGLEGTYETIINFIATPDY